MPKDYYVSVTWSCYGIVTVNAENELEEVVKAQSMSLSDVGEEGYLEDSWEAEDIIGEAWTE